MDSGTSSTGTSSAGTSLFVISSFVITFCTLFMLTSPPPFGPFAFAYRSQEKTKTERRYKMTDIYQRNTIPGKQQKPKI